MSISSHVAQAVLNFYKCNLKKVHLIPELTTNLRSVNAITENGGTLTFTENHISMHYNGEKVLVGQKNEAGLYEVNLKLKKEEKTFQADSKNTEILSWHRKMGHMSAEGMRKLIKLADGARYSTQDLDKHIGKCEICLKAKQTRKCFGQTRTRATRPLQIIHTDLCGPVEQNTWDGNRYFLTFLDDRTHYVKIYLIKNKYEVPEIVKEYIAEVESHWNLKVSMIRCDNGKEYVNKNLGDWCKKKGIQFDFTVPHSPQLNGKAERLNRTLLEKARSMIFDSKINKEMWGEAVYVAGYLLNRSPTETVNTTPYEEWTKRRPNLKSVKMFGSTAYAKVLGSLKKFDERSKKFIFVGYAPVGYRLWDAGKRKIVIARDVVFEEETKTQEKLKYTLIQENSETDTNIDSEDEENRVEELDHEENSDEQSSVTDEENTIVEYQEKLTPKTSPTSTNRENELQQKFTTSTPTRPERKKKCPERYGDYVYLTYQQVVTGYDKLHWKKAIKDEMDSLQKNETWKLIDASQVKGIKPLTNRWVFKIKENGNYKARLVVRGCKQKFGINYDEIFSPVVSNDAIRLIFAIAAHNNYKIITFDVKTAFLYGHLSEEIYMYPPEGYTCKDKICRLRKALYGLKQAPLKWNRRFTDFLKNRKLTQLKTEQCLLKKENSNLIFAIYVDDGIIVGDDLNEMKELLSELNEEFEITITKNPKDYLGLEIQTDKEGIKLTQAAYSNKILHRFKMENAKAVNTPIIKNTPAEESEKNDQYSYREAVGSLLYLASKTRPDLSFAAEV